MTSGLETEWDYSGRKGRDGQNTKIDKIRKGTRMWANAQRDGRTAEYRLHTLFNDTKFG